MPKLKYYIYNIMTIMSINDASTPHHMQVIDPSKSKVTSLFLS
jgi:hypothetical protein